MLLVQISLSNRLSKKIDLMKKKRRRIRTSALGAAGVAVTGFLVFAEAFFVADVAVADVFLSVISKIYVDRRVK